MISVTRTCHARHTNVLHASHLGVTRVTRTCNGIQSVNFDYACPNVYAINELYSKEI